jgi:glyoxylase-like metal-dependent hydrolase (beta-lactamase superfamily II)
VIIIESQAVGPFFKNGFVVACPATKEGVLIDPGDEVEALLDYARGAGIALTQILLTHAHIDHISGVAAARRALNVPIRLHAADLFLYDRADDQAKMFGLAPSEPLPPVDRFYQSGEVIPFGACEVRPHHTPGHCPGGVCLQIGDAAEGDGARDLFVGDTLFAGSIGRTDLPGGDHATLLESIRSVLFRFGDLARVYPGHGPFTTIGRERHTNPFLQASSDT